MPESRKFTKAQVKFKDSLLLGRCSRNMLLGELRDLLMIKIISLTWLCMSVFNSRGWPHHQGCTLEGYSHIFFITQLYFQFFKDTFHEFGGHCPCPYVHFGLPWVLFKAYYKLGVWDERMDYLKKSSILLQEGPWFTEFGKKLQLCLSVPHQNPSNSKSRSAGPTNNVNIPQFHDFSKSSLYFHADVQ